jgi:hypothetical protein
MPAMPFRASRTKSIAGMARSYIRVSCAISACDAASAVATPEAAV